MRKPHKLEDLIYRDLSIRLRVLRQAAEIGWTRGIDMFSLLRLFALTILYVPLTSDASTVDLVSGVIGGFSSDQAFDGTEAVDIQSIAPVGLTISSLTLREYSARTDETLGARIYDQQTGMLLAAEDILVRSGSDQSITIAMVATFAAGHTYRIGFFSSFATASGIDVGTPPLSFTPFIERTGLFAITGVFRSSVDAFPADPYRYLPFISLELMQTAAAVPEASASSVLTAFFALLCSSALLRKYGKAPT